MSRLELLKKSTNTPVRGKTIKLTKKKEDPKYQNYLDKIIQHGPGASDKFNIYLFSDAEDEMLDQKLPQTYSNAVLTVIHPPEFKPLTVDEDMVWDNVMSSTDARAFSDHSYVIVHLTTFNFLNLIKALFSIKNSRIIVFSELDMDFEDFKKISSRFEEEDGYMMVNSNSRIDLIQEASTSASTSKTVIEEQPLAEKKLELSFELPSIEGMPLKKEGLIADSDEWNREFKKYITYLLGILIFTEGIPNREQLIADMTSPTPANKFTDVMKIWRVAFTHPTESPEPLSNYDQMEKLGDKFLGSAFVDFILLRLPRADAEALSEYTARYMSKEFQADFGKYLKMSDWLIADPEVKFPNKVNEDLFEAFSGAIVRIGDMIKGGFGYILNRYLIANFFAKIDLDPRLAHGTAETIVLQGYNSKGWGPPKQGEPEESSNDGYWTFTYRLTSKEFIRYVEIERELKGLPKLRNFTGIIVSLTQKVKSIAKRNTAAEVLRKMEELGITVEDIVSDDIRQIKSYYKDPEYRKLADQAYEKARQNNYSSLEFKKAGEYGTVNYLMLVGKRMGDGHLVKIGNVYKFEKSAGNKEDNYREILRNYIQN